MNKGTVVARRKSAKGWGRWLASHDTNNTAKKGWNTKKEQRSRATMRNNITTSTLCNKRRKEAEKRKILNHGDRLKREQMDRKNYW